MAAGVPLKRWAVRVNLFMIQFFNEEANYLNSLYKFNIWSSYLYKNQKIMAKIVGVNKYGMLLLVKEDATTLECDIKEIRW